MFSNEHFIWMAICALTVALLTYFSLKFKFSFMTSAKIMAVVSLLSELSKVLSHMEPVDKNNPLEGMVIEAGALPFHICSMFIFAFFYLPFCKNQKVKDFLLSLIVPVGIIGSLLAILMATSGTDFTEPEAYQCFIYHAVLLWFAIYLTCTKQAKLGLKAWITNLCTLFSLSIIMIWVNGALQEYDTNFLYVVRPPAENLPLLNLNNGWYAYYATLVICGLVGLTLMHLPFVIKEHKEKKNFKNKIEAMVK